MWNKEPYKIVVGFDFSDLSDKALEEAFSLANEHRIGEVHVVCVTNHASDFIGAGVSTGMTMPVDPMQPSHDRLRLRVDELLDAWVAKNKTIFSKLEVHSRVDMPAAGILDVAEALRADLIVVGTHGRKGLRHFLFGSVAEDILKSAHCPVFVVPLEPGEEEAEAADAPRIEPPCPDCVKARFESEGQVMWCRRHSEHHAFGHGYHYESRLSRPSSRPVLVVK